MIELINSQVTQCGTSAHINQLCAALGIAEATVYRQREGGTDDHLALRDQIQRIALEMPFYGYRRITAELRRREVAANHKLVPTPHA